MAGQRQLIPLRGWRIAALGVLVLAAHVLLIVLIAQMLQASRLLRPMPAPMYTRLLQPQSPSTVPPVPESDPDQRPARARRNTTIASVAPTTAATPPEAATPRPDASATQPDQPTGETSPEPPTPAPAPPGTSPDSTQAASAPPASGTPMPTTGSASPETWPADTQLTYGLTGNYRGPLNGSAHVQWQRDGVRYQVQVDIKVQPFFTYTLTSQGEITPTGLAPIAYEEVRAGGTPRAVRFTDDTIVRANGVIDPRPQGVQDTASQFIELSHRFQMGQELLQIPGAVSVQLARPGGVDLWTYDIVDREVLTLYAGPIETFHLKPRPIANPRGNISAEMWFAPSLLYLPVRIKLILGDDTYLDLVVEKIEQAR